MCVPFFMNQFFRSRFPLFLVAMAISVIDVVTAGYTVKQLDHPSLQVFNRDVRCLAVQQDGKILVGGEFDVVSTWASYPYLVRLDSVAGDIDDTFRIDANGPVTHVAILNDGFIVVAGSFTNIGGSQAAGLAILNPDGRFHAAFSYPPMGPITALAIKPDGRILIAGEPGPNQGADYRVIQTSASGMFDSAFGIINVNGPVSAMAFKPDGKILLGGAFTSCANITRSNLAQLSPSGVIDPSFTVSINSKISSLFVQADGKILLAGDFTLIGSLPRNKLARLDSAGVPDASFESQVTLDGAVESLALQADGNIAIGGGFGEKAAVMGNTGNVVSGYDLGSCSSVTALALDGEGRLLVGCVSSPTQSFLGRAAESAPSSQTLASTGSDRVLWTRAGAFPELDGAKVELWNNSLWDPLGDMTRVAGGWEKTGLSLPPGSWLRVRGGYQSGQSGCSRSSVEMIISYGDIPHIGVEDPNGGPVALDGSAVSFASQNWLTAGPEKIFTIRNTGSAPLENISVSVAAGHHEDFIISSPSGSSLAPGASATFGITFLPRGGGPRQANLMIQSNDFDRSSFVVALSGLGIHQDATYLPSFNNDVSTFALLPDGSAITGGRFTQANGQSRSYLTKLRPDGSLDPSFSANIPGQVTCIRVQQDLKIVLVNGYSVIRILPNGDPDPSFTSAVASAGLGSIKLLPDGKMLLIALSPAPSSQRYLVRLNSDGSVDGTFNSDSSITNSIQGFALQDDGRIIVIGDYGLTKNAYRRSVGRLLSDGTLDESFLAPPTIPSASTVTIQADGKILLTGKVKTVNYSGVYGIIRLLPGGAYDTGFNSSQYGAIIGLQTDGKIWIKGWFYSNEFGSNGVRRLLQDGSPDQFIDIGSGSGSASALAQGDDGNILLGGSFTSIGGVNRDRLARLPNNIQASQSLAASTPSKIVWLRGGSSPEVSQVVFEKWNGSDWVLLGSPVRTAGGWELSGLALGDSGYLRARGSSVHSRSFSSHEAAVIYNFTGNPLTTVQEWRVLNFGSHENTEAAANDQDFDNDGEANLMEYALGSSPIDPSSSSQPRYGWETIDTTKRFMMWVMKSPGVAGVDFVPESSVNMEDWYSDASHVTIIENTPDFMKFGIAESGPAAFLRLRFVEIPDGTPAN